MTMGVGTGAWRRSPAIVAVLAANAISGAGNVLTSVAMPWLIIERGGAGAEIGLIGFATLLPLLFGALVAGIIVDRIGGRAASVVSDLASGGTIAAIGLLALAGWLPLWLLAALAFLGTVLDMPGATGRSVLLPALAERDGVDLAAVNGMSETVRRLTILAGPLLSGVLVVAVGPELTMLVDAVTFAVSTVLVAIWVPRMAVAHEARQAWRLRDAVALLWRDRLIRSLMAVSGTVNVLLNPIFFVLLPLYVVATGGVAADQGLLVAAFGVGTLTGALGSARLVRRFGRRPVLTVGVAVAGLSPFLLAAAPSLPVAAVAQVLSGLGIGPVGPIVLTVLGTRVKPEVRGRVFGAHTTIVNAAIPIGVVVTGFVAELVDVRLILVGISTLFAATVLPLLLQPALAGLDAGGSAGSAGEEHVAEGPAPRAQQS
ncbi:MAG TPA: MFS transporter [Candidatus Limnocylindria bacterium]|nr:MFS transporter [Candidatus Limnocylindria bacterium]